MVLALPVQPAGVLNMEAAPLALSFTVRPEAGPDGLRLEPCPPQAITPAMWEELAAQVATEPTLAAYPAQALARRFYEEYAALAVCDGQIVSYISLLPIARRAAGAYSWTAITDAAGIALPTADVYESATAWTAAAWRRRHISLRLRPCLMTRYLHSSALAMGAMIGLASLIPARLGWQRVAWQKLPFVGGLTSAPAADFPLQAAGGCRLPSGVQRYQGEPLTINDPLPPAGRFCYLWVSDMELAVRLDRELAAALDNDLRRWQAAVVSAFCRPDSHYKMFFY